MHVTGFEDQSEQISTCPRSETTNGDVPSIILHLMCFYGWSRRSQRHMQVSGIGILSVVPTGRSIFVVRIDLFCMIGHKCLPHDPHSVVLRIIPLVASTETLMSPYVLDFDRPVTHSSLLFSWLYETCKEAIEDTCESVAKSFPWNVLLTTPDSPGSLSTSR